MDIGMLWFDNDQKRALKEKVLRAAGYYQNKYGAAPDLCFVHPSMLANLIEKAGDKWMAEKIEVRAAPSILPNHFWIGVHT